MHCSVYVRPWRVTTVKRQTILFAVIAACLAGRAMALPPTCPASLKVQETAANVSGGWVAVPHELRERPLEAVAVFLSHPSKHGEQIPDKSCRERDVWVMDGSEE